MGDKVMNTVEAIPGKADAPTIEIAAHAGTCYGVQRAKFEHDDLAALAEKNGLSLMEVMEKIDR